SRACEPASGAHPGCGLRPYPGYTPGVAATCVARVSEAHPGTRIPGTRAGEWRPSPDAAFGLIRATPGAGVSQPAGSREKRLALATPTVPNHQSRLSTDDRPVIPNPESRSTNHEARITNPAPR